MGIQFDTFCSSGLLARDQTGINPSFDPNGGPGCFGARGNGPNLHVIDLHATFDSITLTVTIPTSLQTFDLGQLLPGQDMALVYTFEFDLNHGPQQGQASELFAQFSDPLHLSGHPALGSVTFAPVGPAAAPEPGTLISLGCGLAILAMARRSSRKRPAAIVRFLSEGHARALRCKDAILDRALPSP